MAQKIVLAVAVALVCLSSARAQKASVINAPAPLYPIECRALRITGKGVVLATVDKTTGAVVGTRMLKSTGNKLLDGSALEALSRWRYKPGTVSQVKIPISFTISSTR